MPVSANLTLRMANREQKTNLWEMRSQPPLVGL